MQYIYLERGDVVFTDMGNVGFVMETDSEMFENEDYNPDDDDSYEEEEERQVSCIVFFPKHVMPRESNPTTVGYNDVRRSVSISYNNVDATESGETTNWTSAANISRQYNDPNARPERLIFKYTDLQWGGISNGLNVLTREDGDNVYHPILTMDESVIALRRSASGSSYPHPSRLILVGKSLWLTMARYTFSLLGKLNPKQWPLAQSINSKGRKPIDVPHAAGPLRIHDPEVPTIGNISEAGIVELSRRMEASSVPIDEWHTVDLSQVENRIAIMSPEFRDMFVTLTSPPGLNIDRSVGYAFDIGDEVHARRSGQVEVPNEQATVEGEVPRSEPEHPV